MSKKAMRWALGIITLVLLATALLAAFSREDGPVPREDGWWYWNGNLRADDGRTFGFHLAFFRDAPDRLLANLSLTDVAAEEYHSFERTAQGQIADGPQRLRVAEWSAELISADGNSGRISAAAGDIAIELALTAQKPLTVHGTAGVFLRGFPDAPRTHYESHSRIRAVGSVQVRGENIPVEGNVWYDREAGEGLVNAETESWDWFGLQMSDGSDLMVYRFRRNEATVLQASFIDSSGAVIVLEDGEVQAVPKEHWMSSVTGVRYPVTWNVHIPKLNLALLVQPVFPAQEARIGFGFWEGLVHVSGTRDGAPISGAGYLEMTGYRY